MWLACHRGVHSFFVFVGVAGELCIHLVCCAAVCLHVYHILEGPRDQREILQRDCGRVPEGPEKGPCKYWDGTGTTQVCFRRLNPNPNPNPVLHVVHSFGVWHPAESFWIWTSMPAVVRKLPLLWIKASAIRLNDKYFFLYSLSLCGTFSPK